MSEVNVLTRNDERALAKQIAHTVYMQCRGMATGEQRIFSAVVDAMDQFFAEREDAAIIEEARDEAVDLALRAAQEDPRGY